MHVLCRQDSLAFCLDCSLSFTMISWSLRIRRVLKISAPSWLHALRGADSSTIMSRRSLVFYKKKNVTPPCSAADRGRHSNTKEIPIAGRAVRQATRIGNGRPDSATSQAQTKKTTRQPSAINTDCAKQETKKEAQKEKISGGRTPQDGTPSTNKNWDREKAQDVNNNNTNGTRCSRRWLQTRHK